MNYAVVLAGGMGSRFWPLSRESRPKQFLAIYSDRPLIEETIHRISPLIKRKNIYIATNRIHSRKIKDCLKVFDIPEDRRESRDAFRARLRYLGLIQFQQSVWIYPYSCEQEIDFLAEYFKVNRFLTILTVKVQNDEPLREQFKRLNLK